MEVAFYLKKLFVWFVKNLGHGLQVHRDTEINNAKTPFKFNAENLKKVETLISNYPEGYKVLLF